MFYRGQSSSGLFVIAKEPMATVAIHVDFLDCFAAARNDGKSLFTIHV